MYGEILKNLRIEKGLTQQQLAQILGFKSASAIGMVERQERELSVETIIRITDYFGISSDYLMGLVPFKNETEAYHSICIASMKYLDTHPLMFPHGLKSYVAQTKAYEYAIKHEIRVYCNGLVSKFEDKLPLTYLELFELANILFSNIKWSPDFNGTVHLEDFNDRLFSIKLDFRQIDKIILDLSKSVLMNYKEDKDTFIKHHSVLDSKSTDPNTSAGPEDELRDTKDNVSHNWEAIDRRIREIELIEEFNDAEQALKFILTQPVLAAYGGYDLKSMSDEEKIEIANDMLFALRLSIEKVKKKRKNS